MTTHTLTIPNLNCGGCAGTLRNALAGLPVENLHIDLATKQVRFRATPETLTQSILALANRGYAPARVQEK